MVVSFGGYFSYLYHDILLVIRWVVIMLRPFNVLDELKKDSIISSLLKNSIIYSHKNIYFRSIFTQLKEILVSHLLRIVGFAYNDYQRGISYALAEYIFFIYCWTKQLAINKLFPKTLFIKNIDI